MKILQWALLGFIAVVVLALVVAFFAGKQFLIESQIVVNQPKDKVFDYLRHMRNHDDFSPWSKLDPDMKKSYEGTDGTVGFVVKWESNNPQVGKSLHTLTSIKEGERIEVDVRFTEPFQSRNPAYFTTEAVGANQTKVTWGYVGTMKYPTNLLMAFIERKIRVAMDGGLVKLKDILEKR